MSRREDFDNSLWSDPDFLGLSSRARMTYIWSWTNPRCGMAGIYKVAAAQAAFETGLTEEEIVAAFEELGDARFAYCIDNVVWVRTRVKHLRQKTVQIATAIKNDLRRINDSNPLKAHFLATYSHYVWLKDAIAGEGQVSLENPSSDPAHPGDPRTRVYGGGRGTGGRGRGAGKGIGLVEPSEEAKAGAQERMSNEALFCSNFPGVERAIVMNVVRELNATGETATVEAVQARLGAAA